MEPRINITQTELKKNVQYNPHTGIFTWRVANKNSISKGDRAGTYSTQNYRRVNIKGVIYYEHRLAWLYMTGKWPEKDIDHINGDHADNRFLNLRHSTRAENMRNSKRHKKHSTGFKGVKRTKQGRYTAQIWVDNKSIYLGVFGTPEEAHQAYCDKADELFGEFANYG